MNINADEALQYLSNAGIISIEQVRKDIENMKKNKYLEMHQNPVWQGQGKDTRWKTRLPNGKIVAKAKKEDLELFTDNVLTKQGRLMGNAYIPLDRETIYNIYKSLY